MFVSRVAGAFTAFKPESAPGGMPASCSGTMTDRATAGADAVGWAANAVKAVKAVSDAPATPTHRSVSAIFSGLFVLSCACAKAIVLTLCLDVPTRRALVSSLYPVEPSPKCCL